MFLADTLISRMKAVFPVTPMPSVLEGDAIIGHPEAKAIRRLLQGKAWPDVDFLDYHKHFPSEPPGMLFYHMTNEAVQYYFPALVLFSLSCILKQHDDLLVGLTLETFFENKHATAEKSLWMYSDAQKDVLAKCLIFFRDQYVDENDSKPYQKALDSYWGRYLQEGDACLNKGVKEAGCAP